MTVDQKRFDAVTRTLTSLPSRRDVLRGIAAVGIGVSGLRTSDAAEAKKKSKHKKRKGKKKKKTTPQPVVNQFGCLDVGQPCKGDSTLCCSGVCEGKKPKKGEKDERTCAAHNAGFCTAEVDSCTVGGNTSCRPNCFCTQTTGHAGFCGRFSSIGTPDCRVCTRDTDCQAEFGLGAACIVLGGACAEICPTTGQTACMIPCL
jgi:hypothetical protein